MGAITTSTFDTLEKLYCKNNKIVKKVLKNNLSKSEQTKVAKVFIQLNLQSQDLYLSKTSCFFKRASQFFVGRILIALFFQKIANKMAHAVISNYQTEKIIQFAKKVEQEEDLHLSRDEQKKVAFFVSHSPEKEEIKYKIRRRAWRRWKALNLTKKAFNRIYPSNSRCWKKFLSDDRIDRSIAELRKDLELQSDNSKSCSESSLKSGSTSIEEVASDNVTSGTADFEVSAKSEIVATEEETLFQDLEHSQTLPYYLASIEDFLIYLLDSKNQHAIIDRLSTLASSYVATSQEAQKDIYKSYKNIFLSWLAAFSETHHNPKQVSTDDHQIDFMQLPRLKPFVPLLEYLPLLLKKYRKFQQLLINEKAKFSAINFKNLNTLLQLDKIDKPDNLEKKIAALILPMIHQFMTSIHEKADDKEMGKEWLNFCKTALTGWDHPFYSGLLQLAEWAPEAGIKFFLKKSLSNYEPMVKALQKSLERVPECKAKFHKLAEKKIKKQQKRILLYKRQIHAEKDNQKIEALKEKIQALKQRENELRLYQGGLEEAFKLRVEEVKAQMKWENAKEAKELDASVGKIYNVIYKQVTCKWLDNHSIKNFIRCIISYRQITIGVKDLLAKSLEPTKKEKSIAIIKDHVIELVIHLFTAAQQYSKEVNHPSIEGDMFSLLDLQLQQMSYKRDSLNFTSSTWQHLISPLIEQMLESPGLFSPSKHH